MMRSENFSLGFFENISKFIILKKNTEKVRSLYKFYEVGMNIQRVKTELKFVKTQKFWCVHKYYSINDSDVRLLRDKYRGLRYKYRNHRVWWLQRGIRE